MDEALVRLRRLDCCAVSDALDKLGIASRVSSGLTGRSIDAKFAGRAVTVRLVAVGQAPATPIPGPLRHLGTQAIETAVAGDVIVVEQRSGVVAGCWGGILTLAAKVKGVAGVVADGPVRDIDEARACRFPIVCRTLTPRTARGRVVEIETNGPVTIDGVEVGAGDYVIADGSGVAFIPAASIAPVLEAAEMIAAREAAMAKALLDGQSPSSVMGATYENMLQRKEIDSP